MSEGGEAPRPLRVYLGAFGDPGHAFPMLALGAALVARGHAVALQTWRRWEEATAAAGIEFAAAPEYQVFPTRERPLKPYQAAVHAARAHSGLTYATIGSSRSASHCSRPSWLQPVAS